MLFTWDAMPNLTNANDTTELAYLFNTLDTELLSDENLRPYTENVDLGEYYLQLIFINVLYWELWFWILLSDGRMVKPSTMVLCFSISEQISNHLSKAFMLSFWVFWEGHKIWKNLRRSFDKSVMFCQVVNEDFILNMDNSIIQTLIKWFRNWFYQ